ncbi:MAG: DUF11 domain-containing protein, partial [Chloroflexi bacterium]|nr:DUF11 domain-containing protein [Chloroflexota bacterium]
LAYPHADNLTIDERGNLIIRVGQTKLYESPPIAWQELPGGEHRRPVPVQYHLTEDGQGYTFALPAGYNPAYPLIIDPELVYSTFFGGSDAEAANDIAVDSAGNTYVVMHSQASDFSNVNTIVIKINADGTGLNYTTFLGGSGWDYGNAIAVGTTKSAYITGHTESSDFPVTVGAFDTGFDGNSDAFVTKLDANGLVAYSTFLGGNQYEHGSSIDVDASGSAYIGGETSSSDFPTTAGVLDVALNGDYDAFIAKLNSDGTTLSYGTFLGGGGNYEGISDIEVDALDQVFAVGGTDSPDFPVTVGAFDVACGLDGNCDHNDAFVVQLNSTGTALNYATFLGGEGLDYGVEIAIDAHGNAYVGGNTYSYSFPVTPGAFDTEYTGGTCSEPCPDTFVAKLNATGTALSYATYLGGDHSYDYATGIAVDDTGNVYMTGVTYSADFPVTLDAFQPNHGGGTCDTGFPNNLCPDAFLGKLNPTGTSLVYSTYIGRNNGDYGLAITLDEANGLYLSGGTNSSNFPVTPGAYDTTYSTSCDPSPPYYCHEDAFIMKWAEQSLTVSKSAPVTATVGAPITYTLTITNSGITTATNLLITDTLPANAYYVAGGTKVGNVVSWTIPSLAGNSSVTQTTFVVTASQTITNSDYKVSANGGYSATG